MRDGRVLFCKNDNSGIEEGMVECYFARMIILGLKTVSFIIRKMMRERIQMVSISKILRKNWTSRAGIINRIHMKKALSHLFVIMGYKELREKENRVSIELEATR